MYSYVPVSNQIYLLLFADHPDNRSESRKEALYSLVIPYSAVQHQFDLHKDKPPSTQHQAPKPQLPAIYSALPPSQTIPNYHYEDLRLLYELYMKRNLKNPACIVDTNHSNSGKQYMEQIRIAKEVLHSRRHSDDIKNLVKGLMIESYIEPGSQKIGEHCYGKSITDPCLGWDDTERLLYDIAELS